MRELLNLGAYVGFVQNTLVQAQESYSRAMIFMNLSRVLLYLAVAYNSYFVAHSDVAPSLCI